MDTDAVKLPIQLDAPIRVYDPSGNEFKIAEAYMQDGFLCLDIVPNEGVTWSVEDAEGEDTLADLAPESRRV